MKHFIVSIVLTALLMLSAASASAVAFILTTDYDGSYLNIGDQVVATLTLDTSDLIGGTDSTLGWGVSIAIDGSLWSVVGGTQNPLVYDFVMPSFGTVGGVPLVSPLPPNNTHDVNEVRMGIWAGLPRLSEPANTLRWGVEQLATVTLEVKSLYIAFGTTLSSVFASGDGIDLNGVLVTSGVTFNTVPIPEPTSAVLLALGLVGLATAGRREA